MLFSLPVVSYLLLWCVVKGTNSIFTVQRRKSLRQTILKKAKKQRLLKIIDENRQLTKKIEKGGRKKIEKRGRKRGKYKKKAKHKR